MSALATGWPFHRICPEVGASSSASARRNTLLPEPEEPVIDTRSALLRVKSVGSSKATWRRSSTRVRARVSISALMDAVFLLNRVGRNGAAGARRFHEKIQTIAIHVVHTFTCNVKQEATCNTDNWAIQACW